MKVSAISSVGLEHHATNVGVGGSSPSWRTIHKLNRPA
jgi:hypothetical protein